jgi:hypothetical protein
MYGFELNSAHPGVYGALPNIRINMYIRGNTGTDAVEKEES